MEKRYIVHIILLGFFLGFILLLKGVDFFSPNSSTNTMPSGYFAIGVIDMNADSSVTTGSLKKGEDAVLVINSKWKGNFTTDFTYYDGNNDGFVTLDDAVFPYLELFYYNTGDLSSVTVAGIRAIKIDRTNKPKPSLVAIFSDSSVRAVRSE